MSAKQNSKSVLQWIGLGCFVTALLIFTAMLGLESYTLQEEGLSSLKPYHEIALTNAAQKAGVLDNAYGSAFSFVAAYKDVFEAAQQEQNAMAESAGIPEDAGGEWNFKLGDWELKNQLLPIVKASSKGPVSDSPLLFLLLTFGLAIVGGLLYILPKFGSTPGIKHDHIYHSPLSRGISHTWRWFFLGATLLGVLAFGYVYMGGQYFWPAVTVGVAVLIAVMVWFKDGSRHNNPQRKASAEDYSAPLGLFAGFYLIAFYVLLYWKPEFITPWVLMVDPVSMFLSGNPASQWFLYGCLYTVIVLVMGVRMFTKYQHNRYQQIRTGSVMFFQTAIAFLLPEILVRLNAPYFDFKNIWPLNYTFFFDWNLNTLMSNGTLGIFMLVWGIALIVIAVPVITYLYGKRWYCSWVCGCGGLAETMGDPYRQLSDKSLRAWKYERYIIHGVLVFAIVMTALVLYHFFTGQAQIGFLNSDTVRTWYGFLIGSAFAGVVGTGFYPLMGNRVWCRFGCPLAAYLGLVQRFKSRFRITTNGGQCISCGNCSTYCEMGIDVRWYAQRGQDIVRSSCVGCGVCSAVCPRGVLRLENGGDDSQFRADEPRAIHISADQVGIL